MKRLPVIALALALAGSGCSMASSKYAGRWEEVREGFSAIGVLGGEEQDKSFEYARRPAENDWEQAEEKDELRRQILEKRGLLDPAQRKQFEAAGAGGDDAPARPKRLIVYTAQYLLSVYDLDDSSKRIIKLAEDSGGYVSTQTNELVRVRVPADTFREMVEKLEAIGRILHKELNAQDVTEQHTDLSLRLAAKKKYLETLQKLLEKAQDAKAMLEIQKEIGRVIEEIESMEGRLRYLADQVAYSTITVRLQLATKASSRRFRLPFGWVESLGIEHLVSPGGGAR